MRKTIKNQNPFTGNNIMFAFYIIMWYNIAVVSMSREKYSKKEKT